VVYIYIYSDRERTDKINKLVLADSSSGDDENPWKNHGEIRISHETKEKLKLLLKGFKEIEEEDAGG
jgi:hypothetical protein